MNDFIAISILSSIVGGAVGAAIAKAAPWKGAVIVIVSTIAVALLSNLADTQHFAIAALTFVISASITGGAMKLKAPQIGSAIVGALLAVGVTYFVADTIRYLS